MENRIGILLLLFGGLYIKRTITEKKMEEELKQKNNKLKNINIKNIKVSEVKKDTNKKRATINLVNKNNK